jgi:Fe-S-cluster-containing hydrogenase component 2
MKNLNEHPIVQRVRSQAQPAQSQQPISAGWLKQLALDSGADDAAVVRMDRPDLAGTRAEVLPLFPRAKALLSLVVRMNRESIRTPARSVANVAFHHTTDEVNTIGRKIVRACEERGIAALNATAGFPMEADRFGAKMWVVSHKPVAVAAGLGQVGIHRNVIHPRFGSFILLGTVLLDAIVDDEAHPISYNPCVECKLCVAACPTGAIGSDGHFDFTACYTHNYREFMGGFNDWVETIAASGSAANYRKKMTSQESVSMWQSLSFGANYKAAYCIGVCPAGEDVIRPFLDQRKSFLDEVVRPLQEKKETVYVLAASDAEVYVQRRFPHKRTKRVHNGIRTQSIGQFLAGMPIAFQRGQSQGLNATFHFVFTGTESRQATVVIRDQTLQVMDGHVGTPSLTVSADSDTWLKFLSGEANIVWALLRRKIRLKGSPKLLLAFGKCFPR